jgi:hypothetical protein
MSYADQGEQFLQCYVTWDKMWINCAAPKTKKSIHAVEAHIISFSKRIQSSVISREEHGSYFLDHENVFCMDFLHNGNMNCLVLLWYS